MPIRATRFAQGQEFSACGDHGAHVLFRTDADAQAIGQAVTAHIAGDHPMAREVSKGGNSPALSLRRLRAIRRLRKFHQNEIGDAGMDDQPECAQLGGKPGQPAGVMFPRRLGVGDIAERRQAGRQGRSGHVERPAHAVQHIGHRRRAIGPAETQPGETVEL